MNEIAFEKIYRDEDVDLSVLEDKTIAVIGYGSQGHAQSMNMRESGMKIIVGAGDRTRHSSWNKAEADGFEVFSIEEAVEKADIVHILLQDPAQPSVYYDSIHAHLRAGQTLSFAHGFAVLYGTIKPPKDVDVVLFVPNGPGPVTRQKFKDGSGIWGCVSVDQDVSGHARETALAISKAVGSTRVGVVDMTFQHETEGDNYEEQVLYGGTIHLMRTMYNIMVKNGYPRSFAYAKAIRSIRSIIDDIDAVGIEEYLTSRASRTCEFAVRHSGPRVINEEAMEEIFEETERGMFARNWLQEFSLGMPTLNRMRRTWADSDMERTGKIWREKFGK
ncbi:ketol-acid reductoisomerase [Pseudodesulfovibrio thermohalotolerans]|uniref:ketol-acid reductoisomerase n=1 Tax=Pseudodesulfovibrio thermohalotolerans TaxID=2880651 RepID=UPI00244159EA|nr:ketol-acid reductoisomerase [Pseudodesulfovibrio thermohalotolerans]WFS63371.1 ketol-acid reductoisomerase [Pseudodesulfovibrio thermohalotolerans]